MTERAGEASVSVTLVTSSVEIIVFVGNAESRGRVREFDFIFSADKLQERIVPETLLESQ